MPGIDESHGHENLGFDRELNYNCRLRTYYAFPQQDPGPAQFGASPGLKPQQLVSPGPGSLEPWEPVKDELEDINFVRSSDPQDGHFTSSWLENTNISLTFPQASHRYS